MRIGIDTCGCDHGRSGNGAYVFSLLNSFPHQYNDSIELFGLEIDRFKYDSEKQSFKFTGIYVPDSILSERLWHIFRLNKFVKKQKYDVVLYPASLSLLPVTRSVPSVLVVTGLFADYLSKVKNVFLRRRIKRSFKKAFKIITVSQFIKKELIAFGVEADKIVVIHNGVNQSMFYPRTQNSSDSIIIKPFAIKKPFILYPSRIQFPEKKHVELIRAFSLFKKRTGLPCKLVIAGVEGEGVEEVHNAVLDSPYSTDIVLTGYFPHQSMPDLYSSAEACIMPSINEGFGLPVLEAMACGIPVLCAKAGALPEIAGPDTEYFNPDDEDEIATLIERVLTDSGLIENMVKANNDWVKRFTWQRTAEKTLEVLKSVELE